MRRFLLSFFLMTALTGCQPSIPQDAFLLSPQSLADRQMQTRRFETADRTAMLTAATAVLQDLGYTLEESEVPLGLLVGAKTRDATSSSQVAGAILIAALGGGSVPIDTVQQIRVSMVVRDAPQAAGTAERPTSGSTSLTRKEIQSIRSRVAKVIAEGLHNHYDSVTCRSLAESLAEKTAQSLADDIDALARHERGSNESVVRVTFQRTIIDTSGRVSRAEQIKDAAIYQQFYDKLAQAVFLEAHEL